MHRSTGRVRYWVGFITLAILAGLMVPDVFAEQAYDKVVPQDSILFIRIKNYPQFKKDIKQTRFWKMWQEPEVQVFYETARQRISQKIAEMSQKTGVSPADIEKLLEGEIALVLGEMVPNPEHTQFGLLADVGGKKQQVQQLIDKLMKNAAAQNVRMMTEKVQGETIYKVQQMGRRPANPAADEAEGGPMAQPDPEGSVTYAIVGDTLMMTGGKQSTLVQKLIGNYKGGVQSLAASPGYKAVLKRVDADAAVFGYVDFGALIKLLEQAPMPAPVPMAQVLQELGIAGVKGFGFSVDPQGEIVKSKALLHLPGQKKGLVKAFVPEKLKVVPPAYIPADVAGYSAIYFSLPKFYQELMNAWKIISPETHGMVQMQMQSLAQHPQAQLKVEEQLINPFGGQMYVYQPSLKNLENVPQMNQNFIIIWEMKNGRAFQEGLDALSRLSPKMQFQKKTMGAHTVRTLAVPQQGGGQMNLHLIILPDALVIAPGDGLLKAYIDAKKGIGKKLKDAAAFRQLMQKLPAEPAMMNYTNEKVAVENMYTMLEKNPMMWDRMLGQQSPISMLLGPGAFEKDKLPPLNVIEKYLRVQGYAVQWVEDGAYMETVTLQQ